MTWVDDSKERPTPVRTAPGGLRARMSDDVAAAIEDTRNDGRIYGKERYLRGMRR
jgi:hypothetical protein